MPWAAYPTDFIVKAENANGNIAPNKRDVKIKGSSNDIYPYTKDPSIYEECKKAP